MKVAEVLSVPGLRYIPDYVDSRIHDELLAHIDSNAWESHPKYPRSQCYGYVYDFDKGTVERVSPLSAWTHSVALRLHAEGVMPYLADQLIVFDYQPGEGIPGHIDAPVFADTIVSISLSSTCVMEFTHRELGTRESILVEPRSALVLSGPARTEWRHCIPARTADPWGNTTYTRGRRVSLTFRKIVENWIGSIP